MVTWCLSDMCSSRGADLIKGVACPSKAILYIPHQQIQGSSTKEYLMHSGVVDLPRTVVKLDPHVLQRVPLQLNSDSADLLWGAHRWPGTTVNYAVH